MLKKIISSGPDIIIHFPSFSSDDHRLLSIQNAIEEATNNQLYTDLTQLITDYLPHFEQPRYDRSSHYYTETQRQAFKRHMVDCCFIASGVLIASGSLASLIAFALDQSDTIETTPSESHAITIISATIMLVCTSLMCGILCRRYGGL